MFYILAEKTVLPQQPIISLSTPTRCLIQVNHEQIADVKQIPANWQPQTPITEQNLIHLSQGILLPGLIQSNCIVNPAWQPLSTLTQRAIQGGITTLFVQQSLHQFPYEPQDLYTDIFYINRLQNSVRIESLEQNRIYKAYLSQPSQNIFPILNFEQVLQTLSQLNSVLIMDCNIPDRLHGFINSPLRFKPIAQRNSLRVQSFSIHASNFQQVEGQSKSSYSSSESSDSESDLQLESKSLEIQRDLFQVQESIRRRKKSNLDLIEAELNTFQGVNCVTVQRQNSTPCPRQPVQSGKYRFRPSPIDLPVKAHTGTYQDYLLNSPDAYQVKGVNYIMKYYISGLKLHLANLSSSEAVCVASKFRPQISVQSAIHYFVSCSREIKPDDTRYKLNPPIRSVQNKQELWKLYKLGLIDTISGMHQYINSQLKAQDTKEFERALSGIPSLGYSLSALWSAYLQENYLMPTHTLEKGLVQLVNSYSTQVALKFNFSKKGGIQIGKQASFVLFDPYSSQNSDLYPPRECPYQDFQIKGKIKKVYLKGHLAYTGSDCRPIGKEINTLQPSN